jgi:hypothetical protein
MPDYTVKDRETGQTITFRWNDPTPPNEADLAEVFKTARAQAAPAPAATEPGPDVIDRLLSLLPTAGGIAGGVAGGIGGTVGGLGVGGVPGAIGGATLGGAFGESVRQLANRARGDEAPSTPLDAAKAIATEGGLQGVAEGVGSAVTSGVMKGARAVYRGYLKPSLAARNVGKAPEIVETALREGIPVTKGGEAKAGRIISELQGVVESELQASPGRVDLRRVADKVRAFARQRYFRPGADQADYQAALAVADRIDAHPSLGIPPGVTPSRIDVPVAQANKAKTALQDSAASSYGTPNASATKRATKAGARELRLGIEGATGGSSGKVATLNARESKLIDTARAVRQAVEREANQSKLYGVKTLASVGVGGVDYARNQDPVRALATGAATRALVNTGTATTTAIVANRLAKQLGIGASSAARLAAYVMSEPEGEPKQVPE